MNITKSSKFIRRVLGPAVLLIVSSTLQSCAALPEQVRDQASTIGGVLVGTGTTLLCAKNVSADKQALCLYAGLLAGYATKVLGDKIAANLSDREKKLVLREASESLKTGQPQVIQLPDSGGQLAINPQGNKEDRIVKSQIFVDTSALPALDNTFTVAGETRGPKSTVNIRRGPSSADDIVGKVASGEAVHVFGLLENSDWMLVGFQAQDDFTIEPVANGFVRQDLLSQAYSIDSGTEPKWVDGKVFGEAMSLVELEWVTVCESQEYQLQTGTDSEAITDTRTLCDGPSGIGISA